MNGGVVINILIDLSTIYKVTARNFNMIFSVFIISSQSFSLVAGCLDLDHLSMG